MLSTMRQNTKIVMIVVLGFLVVWLVFDVGMGVGSGGGVTSSGQDIGSVNGSPIRYQAYMDAYRGAYDQYRQQNQGGAFTREEVQEIENAAFNSLVQAELLKDEYSRRGIVVTDREIVEAVRRAPPQEIINSPDFQTNGQFDPAKYERFLASANANTREYLLAMESRYREELPRYKLLQEITSDIYVSDGKLWQIWKDTHESLTVRALIIRPQTVQGAAQVAPTDAEIEQYYQAHRDEFRQPKRARLSFIAIPKLPTATDSVQLMQKIRTIRDSLVRGADFAVLARTESADTASADSGGSLGTFARGSMDATFERVAFTAPVGSVTEPVFTQFGIHLIKVDRRTRDSVSARHILFPFARFGARLDTLEARADSLDRLAADQTDGTKLDSTAQIMSLQVEHPPTMIYHGTPFMLGRFRIPDVGVWAFEANVGETSPVVETRGAYYIFRVDSIFDTGVPPLLQVTEQVRTKVILAKRRALAEAGARDAEQRLAAGKSVDQVSQEMGLSAVTLGPLTRTSAWPLLGTATAEVGTAFRLRAGERSGLLSNDEAFFFLQQVRRVEADSAAWVAQKDAQRASIIRAARQVRVQSYMASLQRHAKVKDNRAEVLRPTARETTN